MTKQAKRCDEIREMVRERRPDAGEREDLILAFGMVLEEFRELNPNMPVAQIQAFLMVALDIGLGMTEISEAIDIKNSTASRYLLEMGPRRIDGDGSFGLVDRGVDPQNTRKARYTLSRKGKRLIEAVVDHLKTQGRQ